MVEMISLTSTYTTLRGAILHRGTQHYGRQYCIVLHNSTDCRAGILRRDTLYYRRNIASWYTTARAEMLHRDPEPLLVWGDRSFGFISASRSSESVCG